MSSSCNERSDEDLNCCTEYTVLTVSGKDLGFLCSATKLEVYCPFTELVDAADCSSQPTGLGQKTCRVHLEFRQSVPDDLVSSAGAFRYLKVPR